MMKKRMFALLMALCLVVSLLPAQGVSAEGEVPNNVEGPEYWYITANGEFLSHSSVAVGGTITLQVHASDDRAAPEGVVWTVSDSSRAQITGSGATATLTGLSGGTVSVDAKTEDGYVSASTSVVVTDENTTWGFGLQDFNGTFTVTKNGTVVSADTDGFGDEAIAPGKSLADEGYSVTDPVYNGTGRKVFKGWEACIVNNGSTRIEGTDIMTTAQMLAFPARSDATISF